MNSSPNLRFPLPNPTSTCTTAAEASSDPEDRDTRRLWIGNLDPKLTE